MSRQTRKYLSNRGTDPKWPPDGGKATLQPTTKKNSHDKIQEDTTEQGVWVCI